MFRVALISKPVFSAMRNSEVFFLFLKLLTRETPCSPAIWVITSSTSLFGIFISASSRNSKFYRFDPVFALLDNRNLDSLSSFVPYLLVPYHPTQAVQAGHTQEPLV